MTRHDVSWRWTIAEDADSIHRLLCESDAHTATSGAPAPLRNPASTRAYVDMGAVHVLWAGPEIAASITVTWTAPFARGLSSFPHARRPAYITRLAVAPRWVACDSLLGARCLRHAAEVAAAAGADALRAEANPLLDAVRLLRMTGFIECARGQDEDGRSWCVLYKPLINQRSSSE